MKFRKLPKEEQKAFIESMAMGINEKLKRTIGHALYKNEEQYQKFVEGWKKGESKLRFWLEAQIWFSSRFWNWDIENEEEKKKVEESLFQKFLKKITKNKRFKKVTSGDEKQVEKIAKKEERKIEFIDKQIKRRAGK